MIATASAAVSAGLADMPARDGFAVADVTGGLVPIKASYPLRMTLSRHGTITSARVDPRQPPAIFRRLRDAGLGHASEGPCGGTGRRARLKIEFRKECWFDSGQGHQIENTSKNNNLHP